MTTPHVGLRLLDGVDQTFRVLYAFFVLYGRWRIVYVNVIRHASAQLR
jgi:hypothetical protein